MAGWMRQNGWPCNVFLGQGNKCYLAETTYFSLYFLPLFFVPFFIFVLYWLNLSNGEQMINENYWWILLTYMWWISESTIMYSSWRMLEERYYFVFHGGSYFGITESWKDSCEASCFLVDIFVNFWEFNEVWLGLLKLCSIDLVQSWLSFAISCSQSQNAVLILSSQFRVNFKKNQFINAQQWTTEFNDYLFLYQK